VKLTHTIRQEVSRLQDWIVPLAAQAVTPDRKAFSGIALSLRLYEADGLSRVRVAIFEPDIYRLVRSALASQFRQDRDH
jgi:hypothetical protein